MTGEFFDHLENAAGEGRELNVAVSGGRTPDFFYNALSEADSERKELLSGLKLFWVDERCVPPESPDSNYSKVKKLLLDKCNIPDEKIFRIRGEDTPEAEAERYSRVLKENLPFRNSFPFFDLVFLGVGTDGHTASLFPGSPLLEEKKRFTGIARSPENGQKRITLTLPVINNAGKIIFLVTGAEKRPIVRTLCRYEKGVIQYPASLVRNREQNVEWYVDNLAWSTWEQDSDIY